MISLSSVLFEDTFSDLVKKFPSLEEKLKKAKEIFDLKLQGQNKQKYLPWIARIIQKTSEPVEDIVGLVLTFDKKQAALKAKGQPSDINSYKTQLELALAIQSLEAAKEERDLSSIPNLDVLYNKPEEEWALVMARDTESSCEAGTGTTWCTARTDGQNLFMSYVGRKNSPVVLFYVINKKLNPKKNPNAKLSVGFVDKSAVFDGEDGGLSVNAVNDGVTEDKFYEILGKEKAGFFLSLMQTKANSIEIHPAREEFENLLNDPLKFKAKLSSFKKKDAKQDFVDLTLESDIPDENLESIITIIADDKDINFEYIDYFFNHNNRGEMPLFAQKKILNMEDGYGIVLLLSMPFEIHPEIVDAVINLTESSKQALRLIRKQNNDLPPSQIMKIYKKFYNEYELLNYLLDYNLLPTEAAFDILEKIDMWNNQPKAKEQLMIKVFSHYKITLALFERFKDDFGAQVGILLNPNITLEPELQYNITKRLVEVYINTSTTNADLIKINEALTRLRSNENLSSEMFNLLLKQSLARPSIMNKSIPFRFFQNPHFTKEITKLLLNSIFTYNNNTQMEIRDKYEEVNGKEGGPVGLTEILFRRNKNR